MSGRKRVTIKSRHKMSQSIKRICWPGQRIDPFSSHARTSFCLLGHMTSIIGKTYKILENISKSIVKHAFALYQKARQMLPLKSPDDLNGFLSIRHNLPKSTWLACFNELLSFATKR